MARAGYGGPQLNPGLLLVERIYSYVQVRGCSCPTCTSLARKCGGCLVQLSGQRC